MIAGRRRLTIRALAIVAVTESAAAIVAVADIK
jgi:hypothetical protein